MFPELVCLVDDETHLFIGEIVLPVESLVAQHELPVVKIGTDERIRVPLRVGDDVEGEVVSHPVDRLLRDRLIFYEFLPCNFALEERSSQEQSRSGNLSLVDRLFDRK